MSLYTLPNRPSIYPTRSLRDNPNAVSMPISKLAITGTPVPGEQVFHFRLSLISTTGDEEESIRIDMQPNPIDPIDPMRGIAYVEYKPYAITRNFGPDPFFVTVDPDITARTLLYIIFDRHNVDKYIFLSPGAGCRHWCASVLDILAIHGFIPHNTAERFYQYEVEQNGRFGNNVFPLPRYEGEFYNQSLILSASQT